MKKILGLLIVLSMLLSCAPSMAQRNISLNGLPDVKEVIYEDSFTSTTRDSRVSLNSATYNSTKGIVSLTGKDDSFDIYFRKNKTEIAGVYAVDLSLSRETGDTGEINVVFMTRRDGVLNTLMNIKWKSKWNANDNGVYIGAAKIADGAEYNTAKNLKLTIKFDTVSGTTSIWVNEKLAVENNTQYFTASSVQFIRVTKGGTDDGKVMYAEDFKLYSVPVEGMPVVDEYYSYTSFDKDSTNVTTDYATIIRGAATLEVKNGALYVTNAISGGANAVRVRFANDSLPLAGQKLFAEYTVTSTETPVNRALIINHFDAPVSKNYLYKWSGGKVNFGNGDTEDSVYGTQYTAKFTFLFDTGAKKYSLWINDKKALTDQAYFSESKDGSISLIQLNPSSSNIALEEIKTGVVRDFVPEKYNVILKEEFNSEAELNPTTKLDFNKGTNVTYAFKNGMWTLTPKGDGVGTSMYLYLDKADVKGNIYFNLQLSRASYTTSGGAYSRIHFGTKGTTSNRLEFIHWLEDRVQSNSSNFSNSAIKDYTRSLDIIFKINISEGTISAYANGITLYEDKQLTADQKTAVLNGGFYFSLFHNGVTSSNTAERVLYVKHLEVWQEDGKNAMRLTEDNKAEFIVNADTVNTAFYVAGYNDDNSLNKLSVSNVNLKKGKVYSADIKDFASFNKIKTFLWENNTSIKPLVENTGK